VYKKQFFGARKIVFLQFLLLILASHVVYGLVCGKGSQDPIA
jgi:hypothetical protein